MFITDNSVNPFPEEYPELKLPFGGLTFEDEKLFLKYSKGKNVVVDVGTFCGRSAILFSLGAKKVTTIDIFDNHSKYFPDTSKVPWKKAQVTKLLSKYPNIESKEIPSSEGAGLFKNSSVDLVFIDANHEYDSVKADFEAWYPKVKKNGIIIMHDNYEIFPGVIKFLGELCKDSRVEMVEKDGWSMVFKKR